MSYNLCIRDSVSYNDCGLIVTDGLLLIGMFVIYHLTFLFVYIVFIMYSFWIPQIYCNATRNSRKSLHP